MSSLSKPIHNVCTLAAADDVYSGLVLDARSYQLRTRNWWITFPDGLIDVPDFGVYLRNCDGNPTWIPPYNVYNNLWTSYLLKNPFEFNWLNFNGSDPFSVAYIEGVLEVLDEQITLWTTDVNTNACLGFMYFEEFASCLRRLYAFCLGAKSVTDNK